MDESNINQNTDQQPTTQPADNGDQGGGKMFTQEEVNQIIKDRLARERAKSAPQEPTEEEKRRQEMDARENKLNCREYVQKFNLPAELLDLFDTSDFKNFTKKAELFQRALNRAMGPAPLADPEMYYRHLYGPTDFGSTKHTPREYGIFASFDD